MFNKIDIEKVGTISKRQLMEAMKRDKDIAAFMQLSRAKNKDGKRETFEGVFNRIDTEGKFRLYTAFPCSKLIVCRD
ncbi:hypothetical protein Mapa_015799 [Marchantia paleacea]|nr:hypothetical protein Mapa_015799 [Marchantia paleacea]